MFDILYVWTIFTSKKLVSCGVYASLYTKDLSIAILQII